MEFATTTTSSEKYGKIETTTPIIPRMPTSSTTGRSLSSLFLAGLNHNNYSTTTSSPSSSTISSLFSSTTSTAVKAEEAELETEKIESLLLGNKAVSDLQDYYSATTTNFTNFTNNSSSISTNLSSILFPTFTVASSSATHDSSSSSVVVDFTSSAVDETDYLDDLFPNISLQLTQFATLCCLLFIIVGIPGNLLTIIALARCKKVRNATAYFIINLSLGNLLFCCFNLPLALSMFWNRKWIHGDLMCTLFPFARYGLMAVSIFTVLAITINRYVMIGHPRYYPRIYNNRNLAIKILLIWAGSFGAVVPTLFGVWGKFQLDPDIGSCSIVPDDAGRTPKTFLFLIAFVMPCAAIIVCYARIFIIVRKATIKSHGPAPLPTSAAAGGATMELNTSSSPTAVIVANGSSKVENKSSSAESTPKKTSSASRKLKSSLRRTSEKSPRRSSSKNSPNSPDHDGPTKEMLKQRPSSIGSGNSNSSSSGIGTGGTTTGASGKSGIKSASLALLGRPSMAVIHQRGKMSSKDRKLLWMILVIFSTFVICYLPITLVKAVTKQNTNNVWNIVGYILIYMTTCMNPIIYVAMSLEYRQAYKSLLFCTNENINSRTNQSGSWHPSKRNSGLKSPTSTNSDFFSAGSKTANRNSNISFQ